MLNISGLDNGIVLDHIPAGMSMEIYKYLNLGKLFAAKTQDVLHPSNRNCRMSSF